MPSEKEARGPLADHLVYLLKHAWLELSEATGAALRPLGLDGRELAVLIVLDDGTGLSQHEAAQRLGIDRTTMVAMLDALADKGLVARRQDAQDRRRNLVELTAAGRRTLRRGVGLSNDAERRFVEHLGAAEAARLKKALRTFSGGG
jgi:DNA-binding MarR family transcriptional regulator